MGITVDRLKLLDDFCELAAYNNNELFREDIEEFLILNQMEEFLNVVIETLKKKGIKIISQINGEHIDSDRIESEDETDKTDARDVDNSQNEYLIDLYLKEIDNGLVLSPDEEYILGSQIAMGKYADIILNDVEKIKLLSEQDQSIFRNISELGNNAKKRMIEANLPLVVRIAKQYKWNNAHLLDLIQEGNMGLIEAANNFDCRKGYTFSTYATWWIRQAVASVAAKQSRTAQAPDKKVETFNNYVKQLVRDLEGESTLEGHERDVTLSEKQIEKMIQDLLYPRSIETLIDEEVSRDQNDCVSEMNASDTEKEKEKILMREVVKEVWSQLSERDKRIMRAYYGIEEDHTINDTRERVRQIKAKMNRKIINSLRRQKQI